jgi:hypothetical protein
MLWVCNDKHWILGHSKSDILLVGVSIQVEVYFIPETRGIHDTLIVLQ